MTNQKNSPFGKTFHISKSISDPLSLLPSKDINKLSNSSITSKFIPSVNKAKQYKNSLNKLFNLKVLKNRDNILDDNAEIKIKFSHPVLLGKTNCGSLCVNRNDFNIGFVEKRRYLNYEKREKKSKKIIITPSFSNFVEILGRFENNKSHKQSQLNNKPMKSPNLKNILACCNNRNDIITYDKFIFKK